MPPAAAASWATQGTVAQPMALAPPSPCVTITWTNHLERRDATQPLPRTVVPPRPAAAGRPGSWRVALAAIGGCRIRAALAGDFRHPVLDVGRTEPIRDLRSQARRAGRIPRPVSAHPYHGPRHGHLRIVSAPGESRATVGADSLAPSHDG